MDAKLTTAHRCPPGAGLRAGEPLARRNALCPLACADGSTEPVEHSQRRIGEISGLGHGIV